MSFGSYNNSGMTHSVITFLADSDPANGASNINSTGSEFTIDLETPLIIPKNAKNCNIVTKRAIVWFVTPNITLGKNSKFRLTYDGNTYTIDIPTGLYDVDTLSSKIQAELNLASNGVVPVDIIQLLPDIAENKVLIQFNYYNTLVDFRDDQVPNNVRGVLGFNSKLITGYTDPPGTDPIPFYEEGDTVARFNATDYYLIKCTNLVTRGLCRNDRYFGILAEVDVDVSVNSKIVYDPRQIPIIPAPELRGVDLSSLTFQLVNQNNQLVDTRGEYWRILFEIHYDVEENTLTETG